VKVLITCASFAPSYGGPAFSVSRLARAMAEQGHDVGLWAPDGSAVSSPVVGTANGLTPLAGTAAEALDRLLPTLLHDNGIWLPHNHALSSLARRRGIPRVVSPRGMLGSWAIAHKRWRKAIAWALYQRRDLASAQAFHATAEAEAASIRPLARAQPVEVIANGIDVAPPRATPPTGPKTALFVGRIYPVKGLSMFIAAWSHVNPEGWRLRIAGPDEAGHQAEVERQIAAKGTSASIEFLGPVGTEAKARAYAEADLFVLPSHAESFGMAVGEALAHGMPVLTTTAVPWPDLAARGCGWLARPTTDGLADALRTATRLDRAALARMGATGREYVASAFGWAPIAERMATLYATAVGS
jgi:glycosyltransferase involved in cell wall biosynthesis